MGLLRIDHTAKSLAVGTSYLSQQQQRNAAAAPRALLGPSGLDFCWCCLTPSSPLAEPLLSQTCGAAALRPPPALVAAAPRRAGEPERYFDPVLASFGPTFERVGFCESTSPDAFVFGHSDTCRMSLRHACPRSTISRESLRPAFPMSYGFPSDGRCTVWRVRDGCLPPVARRPKEATTTTRVSRPPRTPARINPAPPQAPGPPPVEDRRGERGDNKHSASPPQEPVLPRRGRCTTRGRRGAAPPAWVRSSS